MVSTPRRRWFQFSLRAMFVVVAVFASWLSWELQFIRQREAARRAIEMDDGLVSDFNLFDPKSQNSIPWWRRLMGDRPAWLIWRGRSGVPNEETLCDHFPEALVLPYVQVGYNEDDPIELRGK